MFDRRLIKNFDWILLAMTITLSVIGAMVIYSATRSDGGGSAIFFNHVARIAIGFVALFAILAVDYQILVRNAYLLYGLNCAALIAVEIFGHVGMGAQRWLSLGFIRFQPSEFFKVILIIMLARYFSGLKKKLPLGAREILPTAVAVGIPVLMVLKQPDLGTALIIILIYAFILYIAGIDLKLLFHAGSAVFMSIIVLVSLRYFKIFDVLSLLKEYQLRRVKVLFDPSIDPLGAGYHINQSKIAIGSGGVTGKGFLQGTQSGLNFLPQQHTDFIFSVLAEEGGIIASAFVVLLMLALLLWGIHVARKARDTAGSFITLGVVTLLFLHIFVNIGMATGMIPVVGLPLPFMSYGGSSVLTSFIGIGLIMNVHMRRYLFRS